MFDDRRYVSLPEANSTLHYWRIPNTSPAAQGAQAPIHGMPRELQHPQPIGGAGAPWEKRGIFLAWPVVVNPMAILKILGFWAGKWARAPIY